MGALHKNMGIILVIFFIFFAVVLEDVIGVQYIQLELNRHVEASLKERGVFIRDVLDVEDSNCTLLKTGVEESKQETVQFHGQYLHNVLTYYQKAYLKSEYSRSDVENKIDSLLEKMKKESQLECYVLKNVSLNQGELTEKIQTQLARENERVDFKDDGLVELFKNGIQEVEINGGKGAYHKEYGSLVWSKSLDRVIALRLEVEEESCDTQNLYNHMHNAFYKYLDLLACDEEVFIIDYNGYGLSSFYSNNSGQKINAIQYWDQKDPSNVLAQLTRLKEGHHEIDIRDANGAIKKRKCYVVNDTDRNQFIVVAKTISEIEDSKMKILQISRWINILNMIVIFVITYFLLRYKEPVKEEEAKQ